uniref:Uncharacterized protein n=1 Tax=Anguilla anguilla TaxID=7936 RepID=A0A0E9SA93_ANGAN
MWDLQHVSVLNCKGNFDILTDGHRTVISTSKKC